MRYLLCLVGFLGILTLSRPEEERHNEVAGACETESVVSQDRFSIFSAIESPGTYFSFCSSFIRIPMQKRGINNIDRTSARRFVKTEAYINGDSYTLHKSTNLFLVYHFSLSLWKVLRQ